MIGWIEIWNSSGAKQEAPQEEKYIWNSDFPFCSPNRTKANQVKQQQQPLSDLSRRGKGKNLGLIQSVEVKSSFRTHHFSASGGKFK